MKEITVIQNKIYEIRGQRVMLDRDLAELYGVTTSALNQAVKRNSDRFPPDFMFRLTDAETENWKSQIVISNSVTMGLRRNPYAFTEQGVSMLSAVLKSSVAVQTSIVIMRAFVAMRNYIATTTSVTAELAELRAKLALLERNDEDNAEAINDLYGRHAPRVRQYLRRHSRPVGQNPESAAASATDRVQEIADTPSGIYRLRR